MGLFFLLYSLKKVSVEKRLMELGIGGIIWYYSCSTPMELGNGIINLFISIQALKREYSYLLTQIPFILLTLGPYLRDTKDMNKTKSQIPNLKSNQ